MSFRKKAFDGANAIDVRRTRWASSRPSSWSTCSSSTPRKASLPSPRFPGEQGWYFNQGEKAGVTDDWFTVAALVDGRDTDTRRAARRSRAEWEASRCVEESRWRCWRWRRRLRGGTSAADVVPGDKINAEQRRQGEGPGLAGARVVHQARLPDHHRRDEAGRVAAGLQGSHREVRAAGEAVGATASR